MPLFDWPASTPSHIATTSNFWVYWAVTVPLTILVLAIWTVWIKVVVPRQNRQDEKTLASWLDEESVLGYEKDDAKEE
jgi:flagellar biosynthesis/type III secretory pathway M-ring protein FliF/YscJ